MTIPADAVPFRVSHITETRSTDAYREGVTESEYVIKLQPDYSSEGSEGNYKYLTTITIRTDDPDLFNLFELGESFYMGFGTISTNTDYGPTRMGKEANE